MYDTSADDIDLQDMVPDEDGMFYSPDGKKLLKANPQRETYQIKEGTEIICDCAFKGCKGIKTLILPCSVKNIGDAAFMCCKNLTTLELPEGIEHIGKWAFSGIGLKEIKLPSSLKVIEEYLFHESIALTNVEIPDSVQVIKAKAFSYCLALTQIKLPDSILSIGNGDNPGGVFKGCVSLTKIGCTPTVKAMLEGNK